MKEQKEQSTEILPVSPIYTVAGRMVRLFSDGHWYCTCHQPNCEHIEAAKKIHQPENKKEE